MPDRLTIREAAPLMGYTEAGLRRACGDGRIEGAKLEIRERRAVWTIPRQTVESAENPGPGRPGQE